MEALGECSFRVIRLMAQVYQEKLHISANPMSFSHFPLFLVITDVKPKNRARGAKLTYFISNSTLHTQDMRC